MQYINSSLFVLLTITAVLLLVKLTDLICLNDTNSVTLQWFQRKPAVKSHCVAETRRRSEVKM